MKLPLKGHKWRSKWSKTGSLHARVSISFHEPVTDVSAVPRRRLLRAAGRRAGVRRRRLRRGGGRGGKLRRGHHREEEEEEKKESLLDSRNRVPEKKSDIKQQHSYVDSRNRVPDKIMKNRPLNNIHIRPNVEQRSSSFFALCERCSKSDFSNLCVFGNRTVLFFTN